MGITIDRPKNPRDLVGRVVWLHHQRGRGYFSRVGSADAELTVTDTYQGITVVRTADGREHHIKSTAISLLPPAQQLAFEAQRRQQGASR